MYFTIVIFVLNKGFYDISSKYQTWSYSGWMESKSEVQVHVKSVNFNCILNGEIVNGAWRVKLFSVSFLFTVEPTYKNPGSKKRIFFNLQENRLELCALVSW